MYSIPAPIIKTILDYCDLPSAVTFARVTKRCNNIFNQYREEILLRGEYVNVTQMFNHCSDEFIIHMSKNEFFDKGEARECCYQKRYKLHIKLGYGKLYDTRINENQLREIYEKNEYKNIGNNFKDNLYKWQAAKLGINLDIPYPEDGYGLHAALLLRDEKMINKLKKHGNFYTYCVTGNYHLADNYVIARPVTCINDSHDPVATFNYIEKRGYKLKKCNYFEIKYYEVLKLVMSRITKAIICYVETTDFNALMLIYDTLIKFISINKFFIMIINRNSEFTRFLLKRHYHLKYKIIIHDLYHISLIDLLDVLDNKKIMKYACKHNEYYLIRALIKRNDRQWVSKFNHPFIKKYYS